MLLIGGSLGIRQGMLAYDLHGWEDLEDLPNIKVPSQHLQVNALFLGLTDSTELLYKKLSSAISPTLPRHRLECTQHRQA